MNILLDTRCYIITFVIIEAVMAAQSSFEFTSVVGGGGGCDVIFHITEGGLELFFCFGGGGVLSKFLLDNSIFSVPPPDNYCTVPYDITTAVKQFVLL